MKTRNSTTPQGLVKQLNTSMRGGYVYLVRADGKRDRIYSARSKKGSISVRVLATGTWVDVSASDRFEVL